jgi:hypothetical protein
MNETDKTEKKSLDVKDIPAALLTSFHKAGRYAIILFVVFLAVVYGALLYRVNTLSSAEPTEEAVAKASTPRIDPDIVNKLLDLRDNSVQVKTLFDEARNNPFQE